MKAALQILLVIGFLNSCNNKKTRDEENPILVAQREAPIGWIWLNLYPDSTFEYLSGGKREKTRYTGNFRIQSDTIIFNYKDSIPLVGSKAVLSHSDLLYLHGQNKEKLNVVINEIKLSKNK